tara:strand:+ start:2790 stop:3110 length:321 start_codon:yes stop_codon:yes gene_type:complete
MKRHLDILELENKRQHICKKRDNPYTTEISNITKKQKISESYKYNLFKIVVELVRLDLNNKSEIIYEKFEISEKDNSKEYRSNYYENKEISKRVLKNRKYNYDIYS